MQRSIIFHHPRPIHEDAISGSRVRPARMAEAFESLGFKVELAVGYADGRTRAIRRIKEARQRGQKFDLLYSESLSTPTLWPKRNRFRLFLDLGFLRWCKAQAIPIGLFYRDVHWRFDHYRATVPWYRRAVAVPLYWYDWLWYRRWVDHLFIPSLGMKEALPSQWPDSKLSPLFPGCDVRNLSDAERRDDHAPSDRLELFYVGGVTPPLYDLKPMFDVVQAMDTVCLTLCCRESEWEKAKSYYAPLDGAKVQIVHAFGDGLRPYYARADLFGLIWKPHPYLDFAMPLKLFEALGYGVPIVASAGTEAARFVSQEGIGWVASTAGELRQLLSHLQAHPLIVAETRKHVEAVRRRHTWLARAQTVVDILASPTVEALKWPA